VSVSNPGAGNASLPDAFLYEGDNAPAPQIFATFPATGSIDGGTVISICGQGFLAGLSVTIGGQAVSDLHINSVTFLTLTTPPGSAGACDIVVGNADGQSATVEHGFVYISGSVSPFDVTGDGDVDGADLAAYISAHADEFSDLVEFAVDFGR
jgi:hypothetical protein